MADTSKLRRLVEIEASAAAAHTKQQAGQRLSQEEEAVLQQQAALQAEVQAEQDEAERRTSRAGGPQAQAGAGAQCP